MSEETQTNLNEVIGGADDQIAEGGDDPQMSAEEAISIFNRVYKA